MGGINQIINIYSNINCMTDQQKGYGLGIILGFRLPCPRGARAVRGECAGAPGKAARGHAGPRPARALPPLLSIRISPLHTYDEINLIKTLILFVLKTI